MKTKMIDIFFIVSCLLIAGSCADDKSKDSDDDSAGANLTGDGEVIIPDKEIETEVPADLAILPPDPGCSSTLCISMPTGISFNGIQFPTLISLLDPFSILSPTLIFCGAK